MSESLGYSFEPKPKDPRERYAEKLWERAELLSEDRAQLGASRDALYDQVASMRSSGSLGPLRQQELISKEAAYWEQCARIGEMQRLDDSLTEALLALESGEYDEAKIRALLPDVEEEKRLSKRKQKILEEKARTGEDPREAALAKGFVSEPYRLTTGRNRRKIAGDYDPFTADQAFYSATADTHGGKVANGKRGGFYTGANGRRIRKF